MCVGCCQEAEQNRLEVEMQKRRERIEQWRAARKPKQEDLPPVQAAPASRKWTLEDEEDEDAENDVTATHNGETEDLDPLDAYMQVLLVVLWLQPYSSVQITVVQVIDIKEIDCDGMDMFQKGMMMIG